MKTYKRKNNIAVFTDCMLLFIFMDVLSDCLSKMTVIPTPSQELLVNTTLTCMSSNTASSTTYYWLNGATVASHDAMVTVSEAGPFFLTCVANFSINEVVCINTLNISGTAVSSSLHFFTFPDNSTKS